MKKLFLATLLATSVGLIGCDSDQNSDSGRFSLSLSNVEPLTHGFHYEGWLMIDGSPVSTGKFNVSSSGALVTLTGVSIAGGTFEIDEEVASATAFILTIEPNGDTDTVPSITKYLGGNVTAGSAALAVSHGSSLGSDFRSSNGEYILATPTDGPNSNENSGIWWVNPTGPSMTAGLSLPTLPAGWRYEGWVVVGGIPVTTGSFTSVTGADSFGGFSGSQGAPAFPGEDFLRSAPSGLTFPANLNGATAVISVEPYPDSDAGPFTLKPLVATIPTSAIPFTVYRMNNNASSFPTGIVQIN